MFGASVSFVKKRLREVDVFPRTTGNVHEDVLVLAPIFAPRERKRPVQNYVCQDCGKPQMMSSGRRRRFCQECLPAHAGLRYSRFGLTERGYLKMYADQEGKCKICDVTLVHRKTPGCSTFACVDHDHATGRVRGLLCPGCNTKLSGVEDLDWHATAVKYLIDTKGT
jgi:hypothetical protein